MTLRLLLAILLIVIIAAAAGAAYVFYGRSTASTPPYSGSPSNPARFLRLGSTTSTRDSGLLDRLLPLYEEQTGWKWWCSPREQARPSAMG